MGRSFWIAGLITGLLAFSGGSAWAAPHTTVSGTIQDCDGDNLLEFAPGEEHLVFEFGESPPGGGSSDDPCPRDEVGDTPRRPNNDSLLHFLQLSDFQIVDEESPARVEFLDFTQRPPGPAPFSSAYRPQESLTTQVTEAMVRTARNATSPVTGARLDFTILTGDNADSQQYNEIRWFIDILDGTTGDGSEENPDPEMSADDGTAPNDRKIVPDSGLHDEVTPACSLPGIPPYQDNDSIYDGVRDRGHPGIDPGYYEPDSSALEPDGTGDDGDGYSPSRSRNVGETGQDVTVRDFPGLFEDAQAPYEAVGLGMPWYTSFGNHDAQVQGNSGGAYFGPGLILPPHPWPNPNPFLETSNPTYQAIATGCVKPTQVPPGVLAGRPDQLPQRLQGFFLEFSRDPRGFIQRCLQRPEDQRATCDTAPIVVPPDPRRCFLAKAEEQEGAPPPCAEGGFVEQHFQTTGTPDGHGFAPALAGEHDPGELLAAARACAIDDQSAECPEDVRDARIGEGRPPEAVANHDGYYAFIPRAGFRMIMLDSVTDECPIEPFCSEGSFDHDQFEWLRDQIEAAAAAGQYVLTFSHHTLGTSRMPSSDSTEWAPGSTQPHFGTRSGQPAAQNQTLEELLCQHPNVLAHVDGHEHENFVEPQPCDGPEGSPPGPEPAGPGSFVEVSTAAHIDWPQQSRLVELVDDGRQLSLVLTIVDHDGPANPGGPHPCREDSPEDPDEGCEADGPTGQAGEEPVRLASIGREIAYNDYQHDRDSRGGREDRNVIVPLGRPAPPYVPAPQP